MPAPISRELHDDWVKKYFEPFHAEILKAYESYKILGAKKVYHLDLHSMPSVGTSEHKDPGERRADVVVSDCIGKSCSLFLKDLVIESYKSAGFTVAYNWPYVGGRITETYGAPAEGRETIQVEFNRANYMNETTKKLNQELVPSVQAKLERAMRMIYEAIPEFN